jgi:hypothetical protein
MSVYGKVTWQQVCSRQVRGWLISKLMGASIIIDMKVEISNGEKCYEYIEMSAPVGDARVRGEVEDGLLAALITTRSDLHKTTALFDQSLE